MSQMKTRPHPRRTTVSIAGIATSAKLHPAARSMSIGASVRCAVIAHAQARLGALPVGAGLVPPATCPVCGTGPCNGIDQRWGACPVCHGNDGSINVGNDHWSLCHTHKTKWAVGANLFSSGMDETPEEQQEEQEKIGIASYTEVKPYYANAGWVDDAEDNMADLRHILEGEGDSDVEGVSFKKEARVSGLRKRLERTGYKSIWQTETINHAGDRAVISSWVPNEVPGHGETPKAYKASIYEDILLVERYEGVDGIYPGEYCSSSTDIHGVEPIIDPRLFRKWEQEQGEDDETEEWHRAADNVS